MRRAVRQQSKQPRSRRKSAAAAALLLTCCGCTCGSAGRSCETTSPGESDGPCLFGWRHGSHVAAPSPILSPFLPVPTYDVFAASYSAAKVIPGHATSHQTPGREMLAPPTGLPAATAPALPSQTGPTVEALPQNRDSGTRSNIGPNANLPTNDPVVSTAAWTPGSEGSPTSTSEPLQHSVLRIRAESLRSEGEIRLRAEEARQAD